MGTADATKVYRVPGKLAINPTNLGAAFPHGGTALGVSTRVRIEMTRPQIMIKAEEFGSEVCEVVRGAETFILGAMLRQWDADVLAAIFPDTATTTINGLPATTRAGTLASDNSAVLIFTPDNQTDHPAILLYKAIPLVEETAELRFGIVQELVLPVLWLALRDSSDRFYSIGKIGDLSL